MSGWHGKPSDLRARLGGAFEWISPDSPWVEIVGVVGHLRSDGLDRDPRPQVYWPYQQRTQDRMAMVIRTVGNPSSLTAAVRSAIHEVDPHQALYDVRPMKAVVERTLQGQRLNSILVGAFAGIALVLASLGLYGVLSYLTTQRQREFGIRLAVGARRTDVLGLVLKQGLGRAAVGLGLGLVLSTGVNAWDLPTYSAVSGMVLLVVLAASLIPAWRAARIDPTIGLRQ